MTNLKSKCQVEKEADLMAKQIILSFNVMLWE